MICESDKPLLGISVKSCTSGVLTTNEVSNFFIVSLISSSTFFLIKGNDRIHLKVFLEY